MHAYFSFTGLISWHVTSCLAFDLPGWRQNLSVCWLENQKEELQTMQGVHGWIEPFDIVFVAYCCGIFVPASFVFLLLCISFSDRGFKCRLLNVLLTFRHNFMFLRKSTQNARESILQWVKDAASSSCVQLLVISISYRRWLFSCPILVAYWSFNTNIFS